MRFRICGLIILVLTAFYSCKPKPDYKTVMHDPMLYTKAMHDLNYIVIYDIFTPPVASRVFAYSNIAGYEVMAKGDSSLPDLNGKIKDLNNIPEPPKDAQIDYPFASIIALTKVGDALTFSPDSVAHLVDSIKAIAKSTNMTSDMYEASIKYGEEVADSVLSWSKKDNYAQTRGAKFTVTGLEGHWQPTPPGYFDAVEPKWQTIRAIGMDSANEIKVPGPPPFSKEKGSAFYNMALDVDTVSANVDTTQRWIANFWDCNSFKLHVGGHVMFATKAMTPCGHWEEIVGNISHLKNADFGHTVLAYTAASIGMFNGFIASWWCKYNYDLIRPETYINLYIDPNWRPYLQTPPFPEYQSAHSTISAASARILSRLYGENTEFTDSSERDWGWPDRSFKTFNDAAWEVSLSRFYGGIHYRKSVYDGYVQGTKIGDLVMDRLFTKAEGQMSKK